MKKRTLYLDILRICAIIMVLFNHRGCYDFCLQKPIGSFSFIFSAVLSVLCKCGSPLFFMISGILLLGKDESFLTILRKRVLRIFIVMLIASLWIAKDNLTLSNYLKTLLGGCNWYLYAYIGYLIMLPFLRSMIRNWQAKEWQLFIMLFIGCYTLSGLLTFFQVQQSFLSKLPLLTSGWASSCWHIVFPLLGYYLANADKWNTKTSDSKKRLIIWSCGAVFSVGISALLIALDIRFHSGKNLEMLRQYFIAVPCGCLLLIAKGADEKYSLKTPEPIKRIISECSQATFGVYLIEVCTKSSKWLFTNLADPTKAVVGVYGSFILAVIIEFIIYTAVIIPIRRIPGIKKLL
ncbi:MAG: acyltransferase [Clostridiales bacterium]|nr:acyltransferase [Candidatus Equinaster intestinalis]